MVWLKRFFFFAIVNAKIWMSFRQYLGSGAGTGEESWAPPWLHIWGSSNGWAQHLRCSTTNQKVMSSQAIIKAINCLCKCVVTCTWSVGQWSEFGWKGLEWPLCCCHSVQTPTSSPLGWFYWRPEIGVWGGQTEISCFKKEVIYHLQFDYIKPISV